MMRIKQVTTISEFEQMRAEWNGVLSTSRANCVFLTWEWLFTWWTHLAGNQRLALSLLKSDEKLIGIAPLFRKAATVSALDSFEFLGTGTVGSDYLDLIIRHDQEPLAIPAYADFFAREKVLLSLRDVKSRAAVSDALAELWKEKGYCVREMKGSICPLIRLAGHDWESYLATLGSEHRYAFRRKLRQMTSRFTVRFDQASTETEREQAMQYLIAFNTTRMESRGGSTAFGSAALRNFHAEISSRALQNGWLRLYTLRLDEKPVASLYGFLYRNIFYFYQSGFDPDYATHSVGLVMMGLAIQKAMEDGAEEFDMLRGAEKYKFHWAREVRELSRLELYPPGARGTVWKNARELTVDFRKMVRKVLPPTLAVRIERVRAEGWRALYVARAS